MTSEHAVPARRDAAVVRDATLADVPALAACYDRANHANRILRADGATFRYLVAEADGQVVGFGSIAFVQPPGRRAVCYLPWIANLNVREDRRGRGFGAALIGAMERMAQAAGYGVIHIGAHPDNPRALALYQRLGYQVIDDPPATDPSEVAQADGARGPQSQNIAIGDPRHPGVKGVIYLKKLLPQPGGPGFCRDHPARIG